MWHTQSPAVTGWYHWILSCLTSEGYWVWDGVVRYPGRVSIWWCGGLNVHHWCSDCHSLKDAKLRLQKTWRIVDFQTGGPTMLCLPSYIHELEIKYEFTRRNCSVLLVVHCRQENGSMCIPPMETSFSHQNPLQLLQGKNPIIGRILDGNPDHCFSKCFPNWDVIIS